jgi:hypothetical protein
MIEHEMTTERTVTDTTRVRATFSRQRNCDRDWTCVPWDKLEAEERVALASSMLRLLPDSEQCMVVETGRAVELAQALDAVHPELGAPEWDQLLDIARGNAAILRRVREAMRGSMGDTNE